MTSKKYVKKSFSILFYSILIISFIFSFMPTEYIYGNTPSVENVSLTPFNPTTTDSLTANYTFIDNANETDISNIEWYKDNNGDGNFIAQNTYGSKTIDSANLYNGDKWYFEVTPFDGTYYGLAVNSNIVKIENIALPPATNTVPTVSNVFISPLSPNDNSDLHVNYTYSDIDNDPQGSPEIKWYKYNSTSGSFEEQTAFYNGNIITSENTTIGDRWYFSIKVFDGKDYSETVNSEVVTVGECRIMNIMQTNPNSNTYMHLKFEGYDGYFWKLFIVDDLTIIKTIADSVWKTDFLPQNVGNLESGRYKAVLRVYTTSEARDADVTGSSSEAIDEESHIFDIWQHTSNITVSNGDGNQGNVQFEFGVTGAESVGKLWEYSIWTLDGQLIDRNFCVDIPGKEAGITSDPWNDISPEYANLTPGDYSVHFSFANETDPYYGWLDSMAEFTVYQDGNVTIPVVEDYSNLYLNIIPKQPDQPANILVRINNYTGYVYQLLVDGTAIKQGDINSSYSEFNVATQLTAGNHTVVLQIFQDAIARANGTPIASQLSREFDIWQHEANIGVSQEAPFNVSFNTYITNSIGKYYFIGIRNADTNEEKYPANGSISTSPFSTNSFVTLTAGTYDANLSLGSTSDGRLAHWETGIRFTVDLNGNVILPSDDNLYLNIIPKQPDQPANILVRINNYTGYVYQLLVDGTAIKQGDINSSYSEFNVATQLTAGNHTVVLQIFQDAIARANGTPIASQLSREFDIWQHEANIGVSQEAPFNVSFNTYITNSIGKYYFIGIRNADTNEEKYPANGSISTSPFSTNSFVTLTAGTYDANLSLGSTSDGRLAHWETGIRFTVDLNGNVTQQSSGKCQIAQIFNTNPSSGTSMNMYFDNSYKGYFWRLFIDDSLMVQTFDGVINQNDIFQLIGDLQAGRYTAILRVYETSLQRDSDTIDSGVDTVDTNTRVFDIWEHTASILVQQGVEPDNVVFNLNVTNSNTRYWSIFLNSVNPNNYSDQTFLRMYSAQDYPGMPAAIDSNNWIGNIPADLGEGLYNANLHLGLFSDGRDWGSNHETNIMFSVDSNGNVTLWSPPVGCWFGGTNPNIPGSDVMIVFGAMNAKNKMWVMEVKDPDGNIIQADPSRGYIQDDFFLTQPGSDCFIRNVTKEGWYDATLSIYNRDINGNPDGAPLRSTTYQFRVWDHVQRFNATSSVSAPNNTKFDFYVTNSLDSSWRLKVFTVDENGGEQLYKIYRGTIGQDLTWDPANNSWFIEDNLPDGRYAVRFDVDIASDDYEGFYPGMTFEVTNGIFIGPTCIIQNVWSGTTPNSNTQLLFQTTNANNFYWKITTEKIGDSIDPIIKNGNIMDNDSFKIQSIGDLLEGQYISTLEIFMTEDDMLSGVYPISSDTLNFSIWPHVVETNLTQIIPFEVTFNASVTNSDGRAWKVVYIAPDGSYNEETGILHGDPAELAVPFTAVAGSYTIYLLIDNSIEKIIKSEVIPPAEPQNPGGPIIPVSTKIDSIVESGTSAVVESIGQVTVELTSFGIDEINNQGMSVAGAEIYVDLKLTGVDPEITDLTKVVNEIIFTIYNANGEALWWNGTSWQSCDNYVIEDVDNDGDLDVVITINAKTIPNLNQLTGTEFTVIPIPPADVEPPQITINTPQDGSTYFVNQQVIADFSVTDVGSGIKTTESTIPNGSVIDTTSAGLKEFSVTSTDNDGNTKTETISYEVVKKETGISINPVSTVQYSDILNVSATLSSNSVSLESLPVSFDSIISPAVPSITGLNGEASASYKVINQYGTYSVSAEFAENSEYLASNKEVPVIVTKENATLLYNGDTIVNVASAVKLSCMVSEEQDGNLGNISLAGPITFEVSNNESIVGVYTASVLETSPGFGLAQTSVNLPAGVYKIVAKIDSNYYSAAQTNEALLAVFDPNGGFVSGGGWLTSSGSSKKVNFGFEAKYENKGILKGSFEIIDHNTKDKYKSTQFDWLVVGSSNACLYGFMSINGEGSYPFIAQMVDNGSPGKDHDIFFISINTGSGTIIYSELISGGNIVVHNK